MSATARELDASPVLSARHVVKHYGGVQALKGVDFDIYPGTVTTLFGENGAGKSTLMKILSGVEQPTAGELILDGAPVVFSSTVDARDQGISIIHQELSLSPNMSVADNIFMGREICNPFGLIRGKKQVEEANRLMREIGFTSKVFNPESTVGHLSGGERQGVAIARALYNEADVIVLDEPTTALSLTETQKVFRFVEAVRNSGRTVVFIGHNIYHVWDIADRFFVIDRGREAFEGEKSAFRGADHLIELMHQLAETGQADTSTLKT